MSSQDHLEAMKWFRLGVDQGYASAFNNLGTLIEKACYGKIKNTANVNNEVSYHLEEAFMLYQQGAATGCPQAMASLGYLMAKEALYAAATEASTLGSDGNKNNRNCHAGCKTRNAIEHKARLLSDLREGVTWLRRSAEMGVIDSFYQLGVIYEQGLLLPPDEVTAFYYYKLAADSTSQVS